MSVPSDASDAALSLPRDSSASSGSAALLDAPMTKRNVEPTARGVPAHREQRNDRGGRGWGWAERLESSTPASTNRNASPAADLSAQIAEITGRPSTPAEGDRSLVVVERTAVLGPSSSLNVAQMEYDFVKRGQADVEACFERERAKAPSATGELKLRFTVDRAGAVLGPEAIGFRAEVARCVQNAMLDWKFTAPDKPTRFELVLDLVIG